MRPLAGSKEVRWDDFRVALALSREGSLKAAARRLDINPTTVTRRLEALESALGVELFERTPDGVHATASLERLLPHAEQIEASAHAASMTLDSEENLAEGIVRITAPPGVAEHFIAPSLIALATDCPRIRVELESSVVYADLTRREADIALRVNRPKSGDLVAVKLGVTEYVPSAKRERAAEFRTTMKKASLLTAVPWIGWERELSMIPPARWLEAAISDEAMILRTNSIGVQLAAVESGLGVGLLPKAYLNRPLLQEVLLPTKLKRTPLALPTEGLWLVGHRALRHVPRVAIVWDSMVRTFRSLVST